MKIIRLINCYNLWWWVNKTDYNPPASGKEFKTREEAVRNVHSRIKDDIRFEEV